MSGSKVQVRGLAGRRIGVPERKDQLLSKRWGAGWHPTTPEKQNLWQNAL